MENGVGVVDGAKVGDEKGVKEEFMGFDESNKSEGDEEFEEAFQGDTPVVGVVSDERIVIDHGNVDKAEDSVSGHGVRKFEEAVGGPAEVPEHDPKEEGLVTKESLSREGVVAAGTVDNRIVEDGQERLEDNNALGNAGETENFEDRDEVIDKSVQIFSKPENSVPIHSSLDEPVAHDPANKPVMDLPGNQGHEPLGTQDANEVKGGDTNLQQEVEPNGIITHHEGKSMEMNETYGLTESELNEKHDKLENASTSSLPLHLEYQNRDLKNNLAGQGVGLTGEEQPQMAGRNQDDGEQNAFQSDSASANEQLKESPEVEQNLRSLAEDNADTSVFFTPKQSEETNVSYADVLFGDAERSQCEVSAVSSVSQAPDIQLNKDEYTDVNQSKKQSKIDLIPQVSNGFDLNLRGPSSEVLSREPEKEDGEKEDGKVKESLLQNRDEQDVQPATTDSSSRGISTTPARPAGLAHSALGTMTHGSSSGNTENQVNMETATPTAVGTGISASAPRPAGLGHAAPLLGPAPRAVQQPRVNGPVSPLQSQLVEDPTYGEADETDETREKLQMIRVKFLRLSHRLGQTPHNVVVAQVLYRLGLAEQLRGRNGGRVAAFSFDRASAMAEHLESAGQEPLDFSCTIMVLGKTGVGKSATINSIFDEIKFGTDAFQLGTKKVQDVVGTVQGIKVRVIDTPGLLPSWSDQRKNEKILHSVKQYIKKTPPDIVLYLDRLDMPSREFSDMPLLRTITEIFGPSIWFNAIVVLTHAASAPPEGPNGTATSYDMFVTQRSHVVQHAIRQAAGDMRLMNPVSLVENHSACRTNRAGQRVLPNGQVWKPHLLLLSFASKILAEANTLLKLQDSPPGKPHVSRTRSPPLPFLLSSLLQSRPPVKLPTEQYGEDDDALDDDDLDDSFQEDESEYDGLPPFKRLTKAQLAKLPKDQKKAYYDELEYREKLFMKKQLKEEKKRRKMMKKMQAAMNDLPTDYSENVEEESGAAASVPVPMPDLALPASFDSDYPTHRYRYLDSSNQWLVRPVLEPNGWDHDVGYEGINVERLFVVKDMIPMSFSGQVSKDKKDTNLQMEIASTLKHEDGKSISLGFDLQSVGKEMAYTLRSDTMFCNLRKNKALAGLSVTLLGDILTGGLKVEDKLIFNRRSQLVASAGAIFGRGDVAYGGSLEATLRDKDYPLGRFLFTLGLSILDWHGDLAIGCNLQGQIPLGRTSNFIGRVNINNKGSGQASIRFNSSDHLQIALIGLVPFIRKLLCYSQPTQFG